MRQAVLVEPKHIEFREVEAPKASDLKEHQVLLNIKRIGICGSEIHSYHGCPHSGNGSHIAVSYTHLTLPTN